MTQNYDKECYAPTHIAQEDLQKMKDNFECLRTSFSGSAPPPLAEGLLWLDTATNILRIQKAGTSGWLGVLTGDSAQKLWIYRNDTLPGWVIDSTVTDKILALRGGEYGSTGGVVAGTWTQPSHQHHFTVDNAWVDHDHDYTVSGSHYTHFHSVAIEVPAQAGVGTFGSATILEPTTVALFSDYNDDTDNWMPPDDYSGDTEGSATTPTWRPAAAVGTMQSINVVPT